MPPDRTAIRRARTGDLPRAAATLAAAFHDYPWTRWVVDDDDHARRLRDLYAIYLTIALELGQVWVSDDGAAAAAWTHSSKAAAQDELVAREGLGERIAELSGARFANAVRAAEALAPHAPAGEHWTLAAVAVHPDAQRRGLGSRVLHPALAGFDERGEIAALETSAESNLPFYERLGFNVHRELEMPGGGPHVWMMRRSR